MKIEKALIIRRLNNEVSKEYAEICAESCSKHNLEYEFIDAVEDKNCEEAFLSVGSFKQEKYNNKNEHCCCHSSHILAWKRIFELNKACLILEHDAIVLGDVTLVDLPEEISVTTFGHRVEFLEDYVPPRPMEKFVAVPHAIGVHACGLTPKSAEYLYKDAINNGVGVGLDRWLMMNRASGLPLYVCDPPQVVCWVRKSTINPNNTKDLVNYKGALTPSWYEGLNKNEQ